jgi:hypothetical protein
MKSQSLLLKNSRFDLNLDPNLGFSLLITLPFAIICSVPATEYFMVSFELLAIAWASKGLLLFYN